MTTEVAMSKYGKKRKEFVFVYVQLRDTITARTDAFIGKFVS